MKKIIGIVGNDGNYELLQFPANFASVWMGVEGLADTENAGKRQAAAHNLYAAIYGVGLMQQDLSNDAHCAPWWGPVAKKMADEFGDYVKFAMDFAGFAHERFDRQSGKDVVFEAVKNSIDASRPALMNFGPLHNWYVVTGYDAETGRLYFRDVSQINVEGFPAGGEREGDSLCLGGWHEAMTDAVVVTGKAAPAVSYDDVFKRMIHIFETMQEKGYFKNSAAFLRDNANFENYDDEKFAQLAQRAFD
ncbi:MAG: C39 family peptidase, partial [Kiritimatiellaeota bacterium]|nr:C39 family peptidase [Kiritimatiellota bacterium]